MELEDKKNEVQESKSSNWLASLGTATNERKHGGWKAMPYILGNEIFEKISTTGKGANFVKFLKVEFGMNDYSTSLLNNTWGGLSIFTTLLSACISDGYIGRFWTLAFASISTLLGMIMLTIISSFSHLHPVCNKEQKKLNQCRGPTVSQLVILNISILFSTIGSSGINPCSIPFGVDQFDSTTDEGKRGLSSFFNWYFVVINISFLLGGTVLVVIQEYNWGLGFGVISILMFCAIILFFVGTRVYVYVKPEGSIIAGIFRVFVAALRKYKLKIPEDNEDFYDPPLQEDSVSAKLPRTDRFRWLEKGAIIMNGELKSDGSPSNNWRLCSLQQVEEVKCVLKVLPIWASGIICMSILGLHGQYNIYQAGKLNRSFGHKKIPEASLGVVSLIIICIWVPIYDRILVPRIQKITKIQGGITLLQRMGIGLCFGILAMITAGFVEIKRRNSAILNGDSDGVAPIWTGWLFPQIIMLGFCEVFNFIGQIEFYQKEFPENMKSVANSMFFLCGCMASYFNIVVLTIVRKVTTRNGRVGWLSDRVNDVKLDHFYFFLAAMGVVNFGYFLSIASTYRYRSSKYVSEGEDEQDV